MKILILCLIALLAGWHLYIGYRDYKSTDNPIPFNVLTVYDRTTYKKWQRYHKEHVGLSMIEKTVSSLLLYVLIRLNVFAGIAPGNGVYGPMIAVILFDSILETVVDVIFSYLSMGIEEKYGFNKTTMDTFFMDQLKSFVIGVVLNIALMSIFVAIHRAMGDWILVLFAGLILIHAGRGGDGESDAIALSRVLVLAAGLAVFHLVADELIRAVGHHTDQNPGQNDQQIFERSFQTEASFPFSGLIIVRFFQKRNIRSLKNDMGNAGNLNQTKSTPRRAVC